MGDTNVVLAIKADTKLKDLNLTIRKICTSH